MNIYYAQSHEDHNPLYETYTDDEQVLSYEMPERIEVILEALTDVPWAVLRHAQEFGLEPILSVHTTLYLEFLRTAYERWSPLSPIQGTAFIPYTHTIGKTIIQQDLLPDQDGFFMTDAAVAITARTFSSAIGSVYCALSAVDDLTHGERTTFAACRPPGHHAGREICGGYCFLNNAAIAAEWLSQRGNVAILDIDFHAGNGTQSIFYEREDVLTVSLHADPQREYPCYSGFADETGAGAGVGYHKNFPLPANISDDDYLIFLRQALDLVAKFDPHHMIVSAGLDIYKDDPLGDFNITRDGIHLIGESIAELRRPTAILLEGGYHIPSLGENVVSLLSAFQAH